MGGHLDVGRVRETPGSERLKAAAQLNWEDESGQVRASRRSRLVELDRALEILEELNLRGEQLVPEPLRAHLRALGLAILPRESPTSVLEKVLVVQEVYLLHPEPAKTILSKRPSAPRQHLEGE
ncbi:MAG: hypothetical protein ACYCYK_13860 [Candidatus Dormibacteria bacterium]